MKTTNYLFAFPFSLLSLSICQTVLADDPPADYSLAPMVIKGDVLGTASDPEVRTYSGSRSVIEAADLRSARSIREPERTYSGLVRWYSSGVGTLWPDGVVTVSDDPGND